MNQLEIIGLKCSVGLVGLIYTTFDGLGKLIQVLILFLARFIISAIASTFRRYAVNANIK